MADAETAKLPTVPETLLKKRKARSELRAKQIKTALLEKKKVDLKSRRDCRDRSPTMTNRQRNARIDPEYVMPC